MLEVADRFVPVLASAVEHLLEPRAELLLVAADFEQLAVDFGSLANDFVFAVAAIAQPAIGYNRPDTASTALDKAPSALLAFEAASSAALD